MGVVLPKLLDILLAVCSSLIVLAVSEREHHVDHYGHNDSESDDVKIQYPVYRHELEPDGKTSLVTEDNIGSTFPDLIPTTALPCVDSDCPNTTQCVLNVHGLPRCVCTKLSYSWDNCTHPHSAEFREHSHVFISRHKFMVSTFEMISFLLLGSALGLICAGHIRRQGQSERESTAYRVRYLSSISAQVDSTSAAARVVSEPEGASLSQIRIERPEGSAAGQMSSSNQPITAQRQALTPPSSVTLRRICNSKLLRVDKKTLQTLIDQQLSTLNTTSVYGQYGRSCIRRLLDKQSPCTPFNDGVRYNRLG